MGRPPSRLRWHIHSHTIHTHTLTTPHHQPGNLFTRGPGAYKIPAFNDVPQDFRVSLMKDVDNPVAVHSA